MRDLGVFIQPTAARKNDHLVTSIGESSPLGKRMADSVLSFPFHRGSTEKIKHVWGSSTNLTAVTDFPKEEGCGQQPITLQINCRAGGVLMRMWSERCEISGGSQRGGWGVAGSGSRGGSGCGTMRAMWPSLPLLASATEEGKEVGGEDTQLNQKVSQKIYIYIDIYFFFIFF